MSDQLRGVLSTWFSRAKTWWGLSLGVQILASAVGAISVLTGNTSEWWALILGVASVIGGAGLWRSEALRHRAESLLRHTELQDGFGISVDDKTLADSLSRAIPIATAAVIRGQEQGMFYASSENTGARRVLDNLRESTWWTEQLALKMAWISGICAALVGIVALWSLLVAASLIRSATPIVVSNVVTAVIALVFAGNLIRLPSDYASLAADAREANTKAADHIRAGRLDEGNALLLLCDYQLKRSTGPMIPDWTWRLLRVHLNEIWRATRSS